MQLPAKYIMGGQNAHILQERLPASLGGAQKDNETNIHTANFFLIPSASLNDGTENHSATIQTFDVRCKEIFFVSNAPAASPDAAANCTGFSLLAGLTTIKSSEFPTLTGSNGFEGIG